MKREMGPDRVTRKESKRERDERESSPDTEPCCQATAQLLFEVFPHCFFYNQVKARLSSNHGNHLSTTPGGRPIARVPTSSVSQAMVWSGPVRSGLVRSGLYSAWLMEFSQWRKTNTHSQVSGCEAHQPALVPLIHCLLSSSCYTLVHVMFFSSFTLFLLSVNPVTEQEPEPVSDTWQSRWRPDTSKMFEQQPPFGPFRAASGTVTSCGSALACLGSS